MTDSVDQMLVQVRKAKEQGVDLVEIRLDNVKNFTPDGDLETLIKQSVLPTLITYRYGQKKPGFEAWKGLSWNMDLKCMACNQNQNSSSLMTNLQTIDRSHLENQKKKNVSKKRAKKSSSKNIIDDEHTVIPNTVYHSWLQNSSDIVARGRRSKKHARRESSLKMRYPLDLPNVVQLPDLLGSRISDHYFPAQLPWEWISSPDIWPKSETPTSILFRKQKSCLLLSRF